MRETASNQDLLDAWRSGDELSAQVLFERYLARLTALARARLSKKLARRLDPEDIVLSAWRSFFVAAANGRVEAPEDDDLWPLLVTLTLRKLSRQAARQSADRRSADREVSNETLQTILSREPAPDQAAILADELDALLDVLDRTQRDILVRRLQGETQQEIADHLGCSERTVRRTIVHVRSLMEGCNDVDSQAGWLEGLKVTRGAGPFAGHSRRPSEFSFTEGVSDADFVIHEMVGQGGVGRVYRATRKADGHPLAVKFLKKRFWSDERALRSLLNELDAARTVQHPHVRAVLDTGRTRHGVPFLLMEWVTGDDLAAWVARDRPAINEIVRAMIPVAEALAAAHSAGVLHCDLKPNNILRRTDGHVFLTDFGFARGVTEPHPSLAGGTAGFLAPEQLSPAFGPTGPQTDVYGLGALLYCLLTGRPPFNGRDVAEILAKVLSSRLPTHPSRLNATVPVALGQFCLQCLEKEPAARIPDAGRIGRDLSAMIPNLEPSEGQA